MIVTVDNPATFRRHGTISTAQGLSEDGSQIVTFAGDWRAMQGLFEAVEQGPVDAEVEAWQIQRSLPNPEWVGPEPQRT